MPYPWPSPAVRATAPVAAAGPHAVHSVAPWPRTGEKRGISGRTIALLTGAAALVAVAAVAGILILGDRGASNSSPTASRPAATPGSSGAVRVASNKLVTQPGTSEPKVVVAFYEDFLCPACGSFEQMFGPTVSNLIDTGAIAADYSMVSILDSALTQHYSSRAGAAAYCVADESTEAFRRFHNTLFAVGGQPSESGDSFPDNARLIELARGAGAAGSVSDCINSGKYLSKVTSAAAAAGVNATPTVQINGQEYDVTTPDALVAEVEKLVGNVPKIEGSGATISSP
ncbi:DsbA family protein [Mycobacterium vicinigordonae]|uniref:DsbA family protein n=2 Tax=Mycobacterium vicinigordonae TaxID=1719132 RepID=A0A7D6IRN8_9MYCO|nr:DsbA family protein [Mycobacterium vicinigordonae]